MTDFVNENDTLNNLNEKYDFTSEIESLAGELPSKIGDAAGLLQDIGVGVVNSIFAAVTILILSIFMVASGPRWEEEIVKAQPPDRADRVERALRSIANAIGNYVGGALVQASIAGARCVRGPQHPRGAVRRPAGAVIFFFDLIPVVGATIGAVLVGIVMLFVNFPVGLIVWIVWAIVYQQIENYVIQPQIQRRAVAVEPFVVIVSVLFGSTLFGIMGAILAIPAAGSLLIAWRECRDYRRETVALGTAPATRPEPLAGPG